MIIFSTIWVLINSLTIHSSAFLQPQKLPTLPRPKNHVLALPILYYTPETRLAFGVAGSYIFHPPARSKSSRPSSISTLATYTQERQFRFILASNVFFKNEDFRLQSELRIENYPERFYGIGNRTRKENEELFTSRSSELTLDLYRKIRSHTFAGISYRFFHWSLPKTEDFGMLAPGSIPGSSGGYISGLALLLTRDSRDNIYFPLRGDYIELSAGGYSRLLGSDFGFSYVKLNLRTYIPIFSGHVLALQALCTLQSGEAPFMNLATLGGQSTLRGYYEGRYRDRNLAALQAEYRLPLFWRLKMVGFAGIGDVAPTPGRLSLQNAKYSAGLGLRYLFSKAEKITLRLDAAFGKGSSGFYFSIFEAF